MCAECHKVFRNPNENERFCPDCKKIKESKKKRKSKADKNLYQIMKDLAEYNKKHGTMLSYGKYVALVDK